MIFSFQIGGPFHLWKLCKSVGGKKAKSDNILSNKIKIVELINIDL